MNPLACLPLLVCLVASVALAGDLTITDGTTFREAQAIGIRDDPYHVKIVHKGGVARVAYADMAERDRRKYGYNVEKVAAIEAAANAKRKALAREEAERADAKVIDNFAKEREEVQKRLNEEERATQQLRDRAERAKKEESDRQEAERQKKLAEAKAAAEREAAILLVNGVAYDFYPHLNSSRYTTRMDGEVLQVLDDGLLVISHDIVFKVKDYEGQDSVTDGQKVRSYGLWIGRSQYIAVTGATKTVGVFYCARRPNRKIPQSEVHTIDIPAD